MIRRSGGLSQNHVALLLVEGSSEKTYFEWFRGLDPHLSAVPIIIKRRHSNNIMSYCNQKVQERSIDCKSGDFVSVVMDVDDLTSNELSSIESQCIASGYDLYISNRSFECWLILHFGSLTKPMSQDELEHTF